MTMSKQRSRNVNYRNQWLAWNDSTDFARTLKSALIPVFIVYIFLQMTITLHSPGILFNLRESRKAPFKRQARQEQTTVVHFVTKPFNDSLPEDVYFRLTRTVPLKAKDPLQSKCSSNVRLLRGYQRKTKGFLTLGLSTVPRERAFYLPQALESLLSKMTALDKKEIVIVIFLGSCNHTWINKTLTVLDTKFAENISSGLIQVIQPEESIYPNFTEITKRNFNDTLTRVHWRTKQNIDYAYLFAYCEKLSEYYIHVEDDVIAANGYITEIRMFLQRINKSKQKWFLIEFSSLGFIGKFFRSSDLCTMKDYFLLFKDEKPCDLLINDLRSIKTQTKPIKIPRSLFQHFGLSSSLQGKVQNLRDRNFKDLVRPASSGKRNMSMLPNGHSLVDLTLDYKTNKIPNPPACVFTSLQATVPLSPYLPYSVEKKGYFLTKPPKVRDFYRIIFKSPTNISLVHIRTGHPRLKTLMLQHATVKAGLRANGTRCIHEQELGNFQRGEFYVKLNHTERIKCLEVLVTRPQNTLLILAEIIIKSAPVLRHINTNAITDTNVKILDKKIKQT